MFLGSGRQEGRRRQRLKVSNSQTIAASTGWNNMKNLARDIRRPPGMATLYAYFLHHEARNIHFSSAPRRSVVGSNYYICHGTDQRRNPNMVAPCPLPPEIFRRTDQKKGSREEEYGDLEKGRLEPESESRDNAHQDERDGKPEHRESALRWQFVLFAF